MERVRVSEVSVHSPGKVTKRVCFQRPEVLAFVLTLSPGQAVPAHRHPGSALVMHVSAGSGLVIVDGKENPVLPGDVLLLDGEEELAIRNTGEEALLLLVSLSPNPSDPRFAQEHG
jgi:quercetin dioxygenase-like cupin family protein